MKKGKKEKLSLNRISNGLNSKILINKTLDDKSKYVNVPKWSVCIGSLSYALLFTILTAAILIVYCAPRPGLYLETCDKRSCSKDQNLKCINKICNCKNDQYYVTQCIDKKPILGFCQKDNQCLSNLHCIGGKCQCYDNQYWDGTQCITQKNYQDLCSSEKECLSLKFLSCNNTIGKCTCENTRFWDNEFCIKKRNMNERCASTSECDDNQQLTCINKFCKCTTNEYYDGICSLKIAYQKNCQYSYQCESNYVCVNGICTCSSSYYLSNSVCYPRKILNDPCVGDQCLTTALLYCNSSLGKCICESNNLWNGARCTRKRILYESCTTTSECNETMSLMCINGNCTCLPSEYFFDKCSQKKPHSASCNNQFECLNNMICYAGKCGCDPVSEFLDQVLNLCLSWGMYWAPCSGNQCYTTRLLYCDLALGRCVCSSTDFWNLTTCVPKKNYNEYCNDTSNCNDTKSLICLNNFCKCQNTEYFTDKCYAKKPYLSNCSSAIECFNNLICLSGLCTCSSTHYYDSATALCFSRKTYGVSCNGDQCDTASFLYCNSSLAKCSCGQTDYWNTSSCVLKKSYNESCDNMNICNDDKSLTCLNSFCGCTNTQYYTDKCYPKKAYHNNCLNTIECLDNLDCIGGKCQCNSSQYYDTTSCVYRKTFGVSCTGDQCDTASFLYCNSSLAKCSCSHTDFWNTSSCVLKGDYNQKCANSSECNENKFLLCLNGICQCDITQYYDVAASMCVSRKTFSKSCSGDECETFNLLYCNISCVCDSTRFWNGSYCELKKDFNKFCSYLIECDDNKQLYCIGSLCGCKIDQFFDSTTNQCSTRKTFGDTCSGDQCLISSLLYCNSTLSKCVCDETKFWNGTVCEFKRKINEICTSSIECDDSKNLLCANGYCDCKSNEYYTDKCMVKKNYQDNCLTSIECLNNMNCLNKTCDCELTQFYDSATITCLSRKTFSDNCSGDQCESFKNLYCNLTSNLCECTQTDFWNSSFCIAKFNYNNTCTNDIECDDSKNLKCLQTICQCANNEYFNGMCIIKKEYLASCINSNECLSNLKCLNDTCDCDSNEFFNATNDICEIRLAYNSQCNGDQCLTTLDCINGICGCNTVLFFYDINSNKCSPKLNQNDSCTNSYECSGTMTCSGGYCQCSSIEFYNPATMKCDNRGLDSAPCITSNTCRVDLGLTCESGFCICANSTNYYYWDAIKSICVLI